MRIFIGVVTAALISGGAPRGVAEDGVPDVAQRAQVGHQNERPAAPQLLSVEIIPDTPAGGAELRMEKGAAPPRAVPADQPRRADGGASR